MVVGVVRRHLLDAGGESSDGGTLTSDLERKGEGDLCHCVRAPEMVGPHRTSTNGGMY